MSGKDARVSGYECWLCGTTDPRCHATLCARALMAGEAEAIAASVLDAIPADVPADDAEMW